MNNPFLLFFCPKPWRQFWIWYTELVYSRVISFPRGKPTNEIRVLDDFAGTVRDYLQRANKKKWDLSITDLICKGTWSINEDVLFEQCCFPHFFYHYYFVYLFIFWHKKLLSFVDTCLYIGANSRNPKRDKRLPGRQTESYCRTGRHQEQITKISGLVVKHNQPLFLLGLHVQW